MRPILYALIIGALGLIAVAWSVRYIERSLRASLLQRAQTIAASIDHELLKKLTGSRKDIETEFYQDFKKSLINIGKANPDTRFIYVMGFRNGELFFYGDSETPGSRDESLPGDIYADASEFKFRQASAGISFTEGPYKDVWGSWISGYAPIFDDTHATEAGGGALLGVVGVDISSLTWTENEIYAASLPILVTLLLEVVLFFIHQANKRRIAHIDMLKKQEEKLDAILTHLPVGVLVAEAPSGKLLMANPVAIRIFGRGILNASSNEKIPEIYQIENEEGVLLRFSDLPLAITLSTRKPSVKDDIFIRQSGGVRINTRGSSAPIFDRAGRMVYVVVVIEDITREREIEKTKSEFVSIASHQLRTPLTAIKWLAELLVDDPGNAFGKKQKNLAKQIADSNERMIALVDDLLSVSRIERGKKFSIVKKPTNITPLLQVLLTDMRGLVETHHQEIVLDPPWPKIFTLPIDGEKIRQVLQNLLANAIKYSPEHSLITIGYAMTGKKTVTFSVKDRGIGIPASQQKRIFEKFFRAENAQTTETNGNGLGLYIAKAIIEGHGGKIWFESTEGEGTTFYFTLSR